MVRQNISRKKTPTVIKQLLWKSIIHTKFLPRVMFNALPKGRKWDCIEQKTMDEEIKVATKQKTETTKHAKPQCDGSAAKKYG